MPGYQSHKLASIQSFILFSSVLAVVVLVFFPLLYAVPVIMLLTIVAYPAVRAGAMFPDIDHPRSIPFRRVMFSLPIVGALLGGLFYLKKRDFGVATAIKTIGVTAVAYLLIKYVLRVVLRRLNHRGKTHRTSTGGIIGISLGGLVFRLLQGTALHSLRFILSPVVALSFFIGHLSHLVLDSNNSNDGYDIKF